ncbi:hypothetical protein KBC79_01430 [Candidatus Woesebacteria bacterium]|nr:hypothetical protein [Candidatus Woesebacteria bacterium]
MTTPTNREAVANKLPEYARKIAAKMYPQITKKDYSQWEVERLLIAVCNEARQTHLDLLREVDMKVWEMFPRGYEINEIVFYGGYAQALHDVKAKLSHIITRVEGGTK